MNVSHPPTLPTRLDLLLWLQDDAPDEFHLDGHGVHDHTNDVVAAWLKRRYAFKSVRVETWTEFHAEGQGFTAVFEGGDIPHAIGYLKTLEIVHSELYKGPTNGDDYGRVTRDELIAVLKDWEYPHDVAERILQTRRLDGTAPPGATEG